MSHETEFSIQIYSCRGKRVTEKNMMLFSNFGSPFGDDGLDEIIEGGGGGGGGGGGIKNLETNFTVVYVMFCDLTAIILHF